MRALRGRRAASCVYVAPERFRSDAFVEALHASGVGAPRHRRGALHLASGATTSAPTMRCSARCAKQLRPPRDSWRSPPPRRPEVRDDIVRALLLKDPAVFVAVSTARTSSSGVPVTGDDDKRAACAAWVAEGGVGHRLLRHPKGGRGAARRARGARARARVLYHAGMEDDERAARRTRSCRAATRSRSPPTRSAWASTSPTSASSSTPTSPRAVEAYYQEIGRAGRDGKPAHAVLLFNHADVFTQERMIEGNHPPEYVIADVWNALVAAGGFERGLHALAQGVGASEFEVSAALRILEREQLLERRDASEAAWKLRLLDVASRPAKLKKARAQRPRSRDGAGRRLGDGGGALGSAGPPTGLEADAVRRALATLDKARLLEVRGRPWPAAFARCSGCPFTPWDCPWLESGLRSSARSSSSSA